MSEFLFCLFYAGWNRIDENCTRWRGVEGTGCNYGRTDSLDDQIEARKCLDPRVLDEFHRLSPRGSWTNFGEINAK